MTKVPRLTPEELGRIEKKLKRYGWYSMAERSAIGSRMEGVFYSHGDAPRHNHTKTLVELGRLCSAYLESVEKEVV